MTKRMKKVAVGAGVVLLAGAIVAVGVGSSWFTNPHIDEWFKGKGQAAEADFDSLEVKTGGMILGQSDGEGMSLFSAALPISAYDVNGVSEQAESAFMLTATVSPENATNPAVVWSYSFENASSSWAKGKSEESYITLSADDKTATLSCLQAFGEPIIVKVAAEENEEIFATCKLDYVQRVAVSKVMIGNAFPNGLNLDGGNSEVELVLADAGGKGGEVTASVAEGNVYTIKSDYTTKVSIYSDGETNFQPLQSDFVCAPSFDTELLGKSVYFDFRLFDYFSKMNVNGSIQPYPWFFKLDPTTWEPKYAVGKAFMAIAVEIADEYFSETKIATLVMSGYTIPVGSVDIDKTDKVI